MAQRFLATRGHCRLSSGASHDKEIEPQKPRRLQPDRIGHENFTDCSRHLLGLVTPPPALLEAAETGVVAESVNVAM